ncbi:hypothetical protein SDC9_72961 [bioreactor metagenome]|uniref:Uncharacterized protein n=1 Tax=bioreactor metagenome TaxID=1076179 RepID=A0A644YDV4_9ZZZZ
MKRLFRAGTYHVGSAFSKAMSRHSWRILIKIILIGRKHFAIRYLKQSSVIFDFKSLPGIGYPIAIGWIKSIRFSQFYSADFLHDLRPAA